MNGNMEIRKLDLQSEECIEMDRLYGVSFPANERRPLETLFLGDDSSWNLAFYEQEMLCGFMSLFLYEDIAHIIYFAVEEKLRGKGYGTKMLKKVNEICSSYRVIADLEECSDKAENAEQRKRRLDFYVRNGYGPTDIRYRWRDEDYVIYAHNGNVSTEEFDRFWDHIDMVRKEMSLE